MSHGSNYHGDDRWDGLLGDEPPEAGNPSPTCSDAKLDNKTRAPAAHDETYLSDRGEDWRWRDEKAKLFHVDPHTNPAILRQLVMYKDIQDERRKYGDSPGCDMDDATIEERISELREQAEHEALGKEGTYWKCWDERQNGRDARDDKTHGRGHS